jgi:hypothetical protein
MFTKNFNSLPDSLIEATKKVMTEASNEQPTINHLELSEEELNELSPDALQKYRKASTEKIRNPNVTGHELQKRQTGYSTATKKLSGDARVRAKEPEKKQPFAVKIGNVKPKPTAQTSTPYKSSYSMIKEPTDRSKGYGSSMPQRAAASPVREMTEDQIEEALSPEAKKRRDELKAKVRAAKDAYKDISKQAKSPKSGMAPLKSVTPKAEPEDPEESARKHPIDRLRRIALSTGGAHFEFDNGEKHKISRDVARTIVKHYEVPSEQGGLKPYQKEKLQSDITKSHDHMMKHYNSIAGTNEDAYAPDSTPSHPAKNKPMILEKKPKKLDEVPIETIKQVRMFNQSEETNDETPPFEPDKKKTNWKGSAKSRATWLAKHARDAMKKKMKTEEEEDVTPGAKYAKKVVVPEAVKSGHDMEPSVHLPEGYIRIGKPGASLSDVASGRPGSIKKTLGNPSHSKPQKMDAKEPTERKPIEDRLGEENINEREMSDAEMKKREKIVMRLKDKMAGFKKRYGSRAKDVMYATATKMAMKEETPKGKTMTGQKADPVEMNPSAPTKEGIGIKSTTT